MTPKGKKFVILADNSIIYFSREIEVIFEYREEKEEDGND